MCNCKNKCKGTCKTVSCACPVLIKSECVENFTEDLPCSNIPKGQSLNEVLKQLDAYICDRFESTTNFFNLINVGTGSQIYRGISNLGKKELRTLVGSGLINITQEADTITILVNETALNTFIEANQKTYSALNVGTGAEVYKSTTVAGDNTQFNLRKLKSTDGSVTIAQGVDDINLSVPAAIIPDGSETKIIAGVNGVVTGTGTILNPYVISSDGGETKITNGTNTVVTGNGTTESPYQISAATPDGSETKINAGTNINVTGVGTIASPYTIINTVDGSETKVTSGSGITVTGTGTTASPYIISSGIAANLFQYQVIEIDVPSASMATYLSENFSFTGLGINAMIGMALCNGNNGTRNRNGLTSIGYGTGYPTIGATGGQSDVNLTLAQIPSHSHNILTSSGGGGSNAPQYTNGTLNAANLVSTQSAGSGDSHNNMQPYIVTLMVMKL